MGALLFVYGTLKHGQRSNDLLRDQEFLGEAQTAPYYRLYDYGPYPLLVEDSANGLAVQGEVWRVDDAVLECLDAYEGVPRLYSRKRIVLDTEAGPVWAYVFNGDATIYRPCGGEWPPSGYT